MLDVTPVAALPGCRMGTLGDIFISVFDGPGNIEQLAALEKAQGVFVAEKSKVVSLTIITAPRLEPTSAEFRDKAAKLHARFESSLLCSAVVITSHGFAAVIARTFLAAYQLVVSYHTPHQTFREITPAVEWIQRTAPQTAGLVDAARAIEKFAMKG